MTLSRKDYAWMNADPLRSDIAKKAAAKRGANLRMRQQLDRAFMKESGRWPDPSMHSELNKFAVESGQYEELRKSGSKY